MSAEHWLLAFIVAVAGAQLLYLIIRAAVRDSNTNGQPSRLEHRWRRRKRR